MNITQFTIEEVRCFAERQTFEIRPLTFLVGENSTGKSTMLACFQVLANYLKSDLLDFNIAPYSMGVFKDIVRRSRKLDKRFILGVTVTEGSERLECTVEFFEKLGGFEPATRSLMLRFSDGEILFSANNKVQDHLEIVWANEVQNKYHIGVEPSYFEWHMPEAGPLTQLIDGTDFFWGNREGRTILEDSLQTYLRGKLRTILKSPFYDWDFMKAVDVISTSPIRSQPKRTYDPTMENSDLEGSDIPMRLMRLRAAKKEEWESLRELLIDFGKRSGLFQSIEVRNFGSSMGDPFQLRFKVRGPGSNFIDVGYGVSQVLPLLVPLFGYSHSDLPNLVKRESVFFLFQQPEIHLHPKAQAELSSLLSQLASKTNQSFIVETHSDYLIDRARIEIRRGNIKSDDVSLIYLEPKKNVVNVHNISFDEMGNMIGVPPKFRDFFLLESDRLMGFED